MTGISTIKYWIENDVEGDDLEEMPKPHFRPLSYIKTPLLWAFYYLKENTSFEEATKDIIKKGGDTRSNAAVVGGLLGAVDEIREQSLNVEGASDVLATVRSIFENPPSSLIV